MASHQVIFASSGEIVSHTVLLPDQKVYLTDNNSFIQDCKDGNLEVVQYLLSSGHEFDLEEGFEEATEHDHVDICKELMNEVNDEEFSLIKKAAYYGNIEIFDLLWTQVPVPKITQVAEITFHTAVYNHQICILEYLF